MSLPRADWALSCVLDSTTVIPLPRAAIHYPASIFHSSLPEMQIFSLLFILGFQIYGNPDIWRKMSGPGILVICLSPSLTLFSVAYARAREERSGARAGGAQGVQGLLRAGGHCLHGFVTSLKLNTWPGEQKGGVVQRRAKGSR